MKILGIDPGMAIVGYALVETENENIELLNTGIPIQYITNKQEFMGLDFYVDSNVLIPQPDTEILVEEVLDILKNKNGVKSVLDLCTGSGAIGVSIAKYSDSIVTMSDISEGALEIARKNATSNKVIDKCNFVLSDMFEDIEEKFDIITSNPPYIKTKVINALNVEVQNEPMLALDGGRLLLLIIEAPRWSCNHIISELPNLSDNSFFIFESTSLFETAISCKECIS